MGLGKDPSVSAIDQAKTPNMDSFYANYPHTTLVASGLAVGLPPGQMGNSEVGHTNLGAGRVVYQNLVRLNMAVETGSLSNEPEILKAFEYAKNNNANVHFIGLCSDGGVHSHINHLKGLLSVAKDFGLKDNVFVHAFTDGRDCDPLSGKELISDLQNFMSENIGQLASLIGRYYAMDRDRRWERVKLAYDVMVNGVGEGTHNIVEAIQNSYNEEVTDEFIKPIVCLDANNEPIAKIKNGVCGFD